MLLDPGTWTLAQRADRLLASLGDDLVGRCSAETHAAAVELTTGPHATVADAIAELGDLRARLARDARAMGLATAAAGMHPGKMTEDPKVSSAGRYGLVHRTMRGIARREPTFAQHVHIGVADPESAIRLANRLRAHLPMLLALSASSPLWRGQVTGLASNRTIVFGAFPRTGLPQRFEGYGDWVRTVDTLMRSGAIPEPTFLWWDVRPQPRFGTVEVRILDAQPRLGSAGALAALVQALARLELEEGFAPRGLVGAQEVLAENRFLAARDGVAAELIDPVRAIRVPVTDLLADVLDAAAPHAAALGAGDELAAIAALVSAPEPPRQVAHAATAGVPGLVSELARQFSSGSVSPRSQTTETHGRAGRLSAVAVRESALQVERDVVELAGSSSDLALENMRLEAELNASIGDLRASRARLVAVADGERRRVERDLHDGAQHRLIALRVKLRLLEEADEAEVETRARMVHELEADAEAALEDLRSLVRGIYPPLLVDRGLSDALNWATRSAPIQTTVNIDNLRRYAPEVEAAVYFCCLEALQNAAKHAGDGAQASVSVREIDTDLVFDVFDNGSGFPYADVAESRGLANMRDRAGAAGGTLDVTSAPGAGTLVHGVVPTISPLAAP